MTASAVEGTALAALTRFCELGVELSQRDGHLHVDVPADVDPALLPETTPRTEAELLDHLRSAGAPLATGGRVMPLSWTQRRMHFSSHQRGAESNSTVPHALRLRGPLNVAALTEALRRLVAYHEMLRTSILTVGTQVVQYVAPEAAPHLLVTDLGSTAPSDRESEARRLAHRAMAQPFDLAHDRLFRPSLLRLAPDDHILLMPIHHLVVDGLSLPVVNRTLLRAYEEAIAGRPPEQDPPRTTYRAHIAEQYSERATAQAERHHAYWEKRMAGKPPLLTLPTDRPRPSVPTFRGRPVEHRLPAELTHELEQFARRQHITPFMLYSAALHVLLAHYSGQDDITIGYPFSGRLRPEQADVVGLHITTLLQRVWLGDDPTVVDLLARVRKEILTGTGHHRLRFDRLVNSLGLWRSTAHHPVFQVLIGYNGPEQPLPETAGLRPELYIVDTGAARFDLELYLRPTDDEMAVMLWAQEDLFDADTARRMLGHLERVLRTMVDNPDRRISRIGLLSKEEEDRARVAGTGPDPEPVRGSVPELVADTARCYPDRIALRGQGTTLTYAELDRRSRAAAERLRALGVGPEDIVGIHADRSVDLVIAVMGILRSGGAYLPLDPALPDTRLQAMVADARPAVVVTDGASMACEVPATLTLADLTADGPAPEEALAVPWGEALAYVIFTSGSTGRPKGVMNTHAGLSNRLAWMQRAYPIDSADTVLQKTPLSFDVSVWELLWPLTVGATLAVAAPGTHRDAERLGHTIRSEDVTVIHFVPSMLRAFLASGEVERCPRLRHVVCSGEALTSELRDAFGRSSRAELHNLYGPTEAAIDVTALDLGSGGRADQRDIVPIGSPISGLFVHVLGPHGQLLPSGVTGEIHIGGIGLARGYVGRPELTAERFVPSPLGEPGARLYRTGDLGRRLPDGTIEFLGRNDDQVKLRGFRIELGEIESAIEAVPGVRQAVVSLHQSPSGASSLAAYLTCADNGEETVGRARMALAERLPEYMVPTLWTVLAEFTHLPSGKVDRSALPDPERPRQALPEHERPWTAREKLMAQLWERTLATPPRGLTDDFFLLGGDSILSIELVAAARQAGLGLTVEDVFHNPTLEAMAGVDRALDPSRANGIEPFALLPENMRDRVPTGVEDAFPLSRLLAGLYYESTANSDYRVYTTTLRLRGPFDKQRMRTALEALLERHPFLRSSVDVAAFGQPVQLVHTSIPAPLTIVDLREHPEQESRSRFDAWFAAERDRTFDWERPPLLALTVHLMSDAEFQLTLTEPFLDGWSVALALNELLDTYRDLESGLLEPRQPVQAQAEFLSREAEALANDDARDHWLGVLSDPPVGRLPGEPSSGYEVRDVEVSKQTSDGLMALAEAMAVPVKSVLLAAHVQVVSLLTGRREVITGLMANGRPESAEGAAAVGMFLNTTPIRVAVGPGSRAEAVRAVHHAESAGLAHRHYPYAQMLRDAGLDTPFDTTFNYTHFRPYQDRAEDGGPELVSLRATDQTYHRLTAQFRRDVLSGGIGLFLEFSDAGLDAAQMDRVAGYYAEALSQMAQEPHAALAPLDRLAVAAVPAPDAPATPSADDDLYHRFASQAARTPQAPALRGGPTTVRYGELARAVERLSGRLSANGVTDGSVVAVCAERSVDYVTAVLAVLRLGAAYAPIDATQPPERLRRLLAATGGSAAVRARTEPLPVPEGTVDLDARAVTEPGHVVPAVPPLAGRTAAVVYTSGSTGRPKGVALPHSAVTNRLDWSRRQEPAGPDDVFVLRTPIGFVDSVAELFDGLLRGVPTVIVPDDVRDPADLVQVMATNGVTKATMVPTLAAEILRLDVDPGEVLRHLRELHLSGEPLQAHLAQELVARLPHVRIRNIYGSTEVCADATAHLVVGDETGNVPVGAPLPGVTARVLHEDGGTVPDGTVGELAIGGAGLATGYVGDAVRTADRFVPSPQGRGLREYRTGDLAVRRPDGGLMVLGRADRQIKVRGVRVEPSEVEAALTSHPDVAEALVFQRNSATAEPQLVAYVRAAAQEPGSAGLRSYLLERLVLAAVPDAVVFVARWPRLPSGKVDTTSLPEPTTDARRLRTRAPEGFLETELATLWEQRLGERPTDVGDDFFESGGNSLHAIVLAGALSRWIGTKVGVADIFDRPTLSEQALLVEHLLVSGEGTPENPADDPRSA